MKQKLILAVAVLVGVALFLFFLMSGGGKPATFEIKDGNLAIGGQFSVTVPLTEIEGLAMVDSVPAIERKNNGSGLGSVYKGEFTLEGGISARLYVDAKKPPFVSFTQGGTVFYLNDETAEKTGELFERLKVETGK